MSNVTETIVCLHFWGFFFLSVWVDWSLTATVGRMQAEATDSSLRQGIEILAVKDTDQPSAAEEKEEKKADKERQDPTVSAATEKEGDSSAIKEEHGKPNLALSTCY